MELTPLRYFAAIAAATSFLSSFDRKSSFWLAMMLPLIFSLPVVNSFIASALPCAAAGACTPAGSTVAAAACSMRRRSMLIVSGMVSTSR